ncbi:MAG TPA: DUF4386 family protein [Thermoplasmata archaeon]
MPRPSKGGNPTELEPRLASLCGIVFGILLVATFAVTFDFPGVPAQADATLAGYSSLRTAFLAGDIFLGLAAVLAIPYFVQLRNAYDGTDRLLVATATLFSIVGIVVTAAVFIGETIALDALSGAYATGGIARTAAVVAAQAAIGSGAVAIFGFLVLMAGVGLYGFLTSKGQPFPRWLGYLGIVAAILSLVGGLPVGGAYVAFVAGVVLFLGWLFITSGLLWRASGRKAST